MRKTEKMTKIKRNQNGITLIALVITIIVLLILAGVAISMLSGENGILKQGANSKLKTEQSSTDEAIKLAALSALTAGHGEIKGEKAFDALNSGLDEAGYIGQDIKELPTTIKIGDREYTIIPDGTTREANDIEKLKLSGKAVSDNTTLKDENGHTITIPKNFNIASESPTVVTKGMIIEDSEDNQYVWIPVFSSEQYSWGAVYPDTLPAKTADDSEFTATHISAIQTALRGSDSAGYTKTYYYSYYSNYSDVWFGGSSYGEYGYYAEEDTEQTKLIYYTNGNIKDSSTYNNLYNSMLISVYKNGGFYIGRYEMGIAVVNSTTEAQNNSRIKDSKEYVSDSTNSTNEAPTIEGMSIPVSKPNAVGYNYITQAQAQMLAEKLGKKSDYNNVTSSIMFGLQWNMVCVFIENFDTNNTATTKSDWLKNNTYGKLWGNYYNSSFKLNQGYYTTKYVSTVNWIQDYATAKGTSTSWLCTTGASNQNSSLNIFDFGGNLYEWTLERSTYSNSPCVAHGASINSVNSASVWYNNRITYSSYDTSSRISLYIK